jgi:DNA-3-methyladenine glycosylase II
MSSKDSITFLKRDKRFAKLIKKHGAPDLKRPSTTLRASRKNPFRALVRAIVYQQLSGKAAATILARFVALFPHGKFPTSEAVRKMPVAKMRRAGLSRQKALYIKDLAEKFSDGTIKHRSLHKMKSDDIVEHLTQVKGVGVWTVHMFLIFTLNRPDVLPTGDLGIRKGFQIVYGLKQLPAHEDMERLAKPWRSYASTASWYLWRAADSVSPKARSVLPKADEAK